MAIAFGAVGASLVSTTSPFSVQMPAGITAGQMLLMSITNKYPGAEPQTPSGWTLLRQQAAGSGASGPDSGTVIVTVFYRIADGTEGSTSVTATGNNIALGSTTRWTKASDKVWDIASDFGTDTTPGGTWSTTTASGPTTLAGDLMVSVAGLNTDDTTQSANTLTQSGATFGAGSTRANPASANGDDAEMHIASNTVTAGGTGAITQTMTIGGVTPANGPCGPAIIIRLREVSIGADPWGRSGFFGG